MLFAVLWGAQKRFTRRPLSLSGYISLSRWPRPSTQIRGRHPGPFKGPSRDPQRCRECTSSTERHLRKNKDKRSLWCPLGATDHQQHMEAGLLDVSVQTNILSAISSFPLMAYQQPFYMLHVDYFIWPQDLFSHGNFIIKAWTRRKIKNHHQQNESQSCWSCLSVLFILMQAFEGSASALLWKALNSQICD